MKSDRGKHVFGVYFDAIDAGTGISPGHIIPLSDRELLRRLSKIIRVKRGDRLDIFSDSLLAETIVSSVSRSTVTLEVLNISPLSRHSGINLYLGASKKTDLEMAVSIITALEIDSVSIFPDPSEPFQITPRLLPRLKRVSIAAREQSGSYAPLRISFLQSESAAVLDFLSHDSTLKLVLLQSGTPPNQHLKQISSSHSISAFIGGPSGVTEEAVSKLKSAGAIALSLSTSRLKSEVAAVSAAAFLAALRL